MNYPKISIITITYNSEKTLEETIKSVIVQNYPNLEYLIIDGGSKDNTLNIVEKYKENISFVISEPDKGISDAFNKGVRNATGEIIGILNSDDVMLKGTLNSIAENYDPTIDVYSLNVIIWDDINNTKYREIPDMNFSLYKTSYHIAHQGRFVTKNAYNKYGTFDIRLRYMMDGDLLIRLYKANAKFKYINHDSALFRLGATTADNVWKKKNDVKITVYNNGGGVFTFYYKWIAMLSKQFLKIFFDTIGGTELKRKLNYKKI